MLQPCEAFCGNSNKALCEAREDESVFGSNACIWTGGNAKTCCPVGSPDCACPVRRNLERGSDDDDDSNTQKLASKDKVEKPKELSNASSGLPAVDKSRRRTSSEKRRSYSFLDPTGPICNKEVNKEMADGKLGQSDYQCSEDDVSSGKYNCCLNSGDYSCETCATCRGYGQILNGIDEMLGINELRLKHRMKQTVRPVKSSALTRRYKENIWIWKCHLFFYTIIV